jgi:hypothetical protein
MAKTIFMGRHTDGNIYTAVYKNANGTGAQDLLVNPLNRINEVDFHSNFAYLKSNVSAAGSITLPARSPGTSNTKKKNRTVAVPAYGTATYLITSTNYTTSGFPPIIILVDTSNNRTIAGTSVVQQLGGDSMRSVSVRSDSTGVYLDEQFFVYGSTVPSLVFNYKMYVITNPAEQTDTKAVNITPTAFKVNKGTFNSDLGYVKVKSGVSLAGGATSYEEASNWYYENQFSLKRRWVYRYQTGTTLLNPPQTDIGWDSYLRADGAEEGVNYRVGANITSWYNPDDGYTYERGALAQTYTDYKFTWRWWYLKTNGTWAIGKDAGGMELSVAGFLKSRQLALVQYGPNANCYKITNTSTGKVFGVETLSSTADGTSAYGYYIRRKKTMYLTANRSGAAFVNGITINVEATPGNTSAGAAWNFDGLVNKYGDQAQPPTNTIFGIKLV